MMTSEDGWMDILLDGKSLLKGDHHLAPYVRSAEFLSDGNGSDQLTVHLSITGEPLDSRTKLWGKEFVVRLHGPGMTNPVLHTQSLYIVDLGVRRPPYELEIIAVDDIRKMQKPRDKHMPPSERNFLGKSLSDVVKAVADTHHWSSKCTLVEAAEFISRKETDWTMLTQLANSYNYVIRLDFDGMRKTLAMGPKDYLSKATVDVEIDEVEDFMVAMKTAGLIKQVEAEVVTEKDGKRLAHAKATADRIRWGGAGVIGTDVLGSEKALHRIVHPARSAQLPKANAESAAKAHLAARAENFVTGSFRARFNPKLVGGNMVTFRGFGWPLEDVSCWIASATHSWDTNGLKTTVKFNGPKISSKTPPKHTAGALSVSLFD